MSIDFNSLSNIEKEKALIPFIIKALQDVGGQLPKQDLKEAITKMDDGVAAFESDISQSKETGREYKQFNFKFNFALKNLKIAGFVQYDDSSKNITLTDKGSNIDLNSFDIDTEIYVVTASYWAKKREENKTKNKVKNDPEIENVEDTDISQEEIYLEEFKTKLLDAISKMSPGKFEKFSRKLLTKMGVAFTDKGIFISNDGGIDGFGYHRDDSDFRTTRVVIQCKRFNSGDVGSPDIDKFRGSMDKHRADYGIFVTNSRFTTAAREAAMNGTFPITLIDKDELIRLVIEYQLEIKPINTYELMDFYKEDE